MAATNSTRGIFLCTIGQINICRDSETFKHVNEQCVEIYTILNLFGLL